MAKQNARAAFIAARVESGKTKSQAAADYKWAAARYEKPTAWHAKRIDGWKYVETRTQSRKVTAEQARREAAELRKAGVKPTKYLAERPVKINEILKRGTRIKDLPEPPRRPGKIETPEDIARIPDLGPAIVFDSIEDYESYMMEDEDIDENDFVEYEEWASSGGGSKGSKKG